MSTSPRGSSRLIPPSGWWILAGLILCVLLIGLRLGLPIWRRAAFLDDVEKIGGSFNSEPDGPTWLRKLFGDSAMRGFDDVWKLWLPGENPEDQVLLGVDDASSVTRIGDPSRARRPIPRIEDDLLGRTSLFPNLHCITLQGTEFGNAALATLGAHPGLTWVDLFHSSLDDDGLRALSNSKSILVLSAGCTRVTDDGLTRLGQMTQLLYLGLRGNDVTDAGLAHLTSLTNLTDLNLSETKVTDAGLRHLEQLKKLENVTLFDTPVTETGVADFVTNHPSLKEIELSPDQISADGMDDLRRQRPRLKIVIMVEENDGSGFSRRRQRRK